MILSGEIHGSDRKGNSFFHLTRDSLQISVLTMPWDNLQMAQKLLEVPEDLMVYAEPLDLYEDPRRFLILTNPLYSRPFPMVIVLKYRQDGDEKVIVDVEKEDLDIARYVRTEYLTLSEAYCKVTLTLKKNAGGAGILSAIAQACREGKLFKYDPDLADRLTQTAQAGSDQSETEADFSNPQEGSDGREQTSEPVKKFTLRVSSHYAHWDCSLLTDLGFCCEKGICFEQDDAAAKKLYEMAAAAGEATAKNDLAWLYQEGIGVDRDVPLAVRLYGQAAEGGCSDACVNLGNIYESGELGTVDFGKCFNWYTEAALALNPKGWFNLANCYHWGHGVAQDYEMAYRLFKVVADQKAVDDVWFYMGLYSQEGLGGVEQNYNKALRYYHKGVRAGNAYCCTQLGVMYGKGLGVKQNTRTALKYYRQAADLGDAAAMANIGFIYEKGEVGKPDPDQALSCYRKAAEAGDVHGREGYIRLTGEEYASGDYFRFGFCYQEGYDGFEQDYGEALFYFRKGADKQDAGCINQLGVMYARGLGIEKDTQAALTCYRKAGEMGEPMGWLNAGAMYEFGEDGQSSPEEADLDKARECYQKAKDLGDPSAAEAFDRAEMKAGLVSLKKQGYSVEFI